MVPYSLPNGCKTRCVTLQEGPLWAAVMWCRYWEVSLSLSALAQCPSGFMKKLFSCGLLP